jgi:hypothetical protein
MASINLDSFFSKQTIDNNGNTCTDINLGLDKLFANFNYFELNIKEEQRYLVSEYEENYPDLVAMHSILQSQEYWWWILLMNSLEDPLSDIKSNWVYSINSQEQITEFLKIVNEDTSTVNTNGAIGETVTLG